MKEKIFLKGVSQNNLKSVDIDIPIHSFTVFCGPSGSGKSSLAFETLYAEGQRRYIESLSNYTKQFLNKAPKPSLISADNIPPALALTQKNSVKNSRSTVGTYTELIDNLKSLYEKLGAPVCEKHKQDLKSYDSIKATNKTLELFSKKRGYILFPIHTEKCILKNKKLLNHLKEEGFLRLLVSPSRKKCEARKSFSICSLGEILLLEELSELPEKDFFVVVDRVSFLEEEKERLIDSLSQAHKIFSKLHTHIPCSEAYVMTTDGERLIFKTNPACTVCGFQFRKITSALFSFNHPLGACGSCEGFGNKLTLSEDKVIPDKTLTLNQGAIRPFFMPSGKTVKKKADKLCHSRSIDMNQPWETLPEKQKEILWKGDGDYPGILGYFKKLESKKYKMHIRVFLSRFKSQTICEVCEGARLNQEALQVFVRGKNISDLSRMTLEDLYSFFKNLKLNAFEKKVLESIYENIIFQLEYLNQVGLSYLTLDRNTRTLSGGEYQRINLARQLGSGLSETLYVLDEPTIGLHPRDTNRLIQILKNLQDSDNTLVVVEHDGDVISSSDFVVEIGPGSGAQGGRVVFSGETKDFMSSSSFTAESIKNPSTAFHIPRKNKTESFLDLKGARGNNLKHIDLKIPLQNLVAFTGVSGSGKTSLLTHTLYPALLKEIHKEHVPSLEFDSLKGVEGFKEVVLIDQDSMTRNSRSHPASYLQFYSLIRNIMAFCPDGRLRNMTPRHFSLNVDQGRCPSCKGLGVEIVDMVFMEDIELPCEECRGKKFKQEVLEVKYKSKSILDILNMNISEAKTFFSSEPVIQRACETLEQVGLSYISLGQRASTFSAGEAQRLKLAQKLYKSIHKKTIFILDEPTKGLHFKEVNLLLKVLHNLVSMGASVFMVEHNLDVIGACDYVIDLGPEAGPGGGLVVAQGSPFEIQKNFKTQTALYLKEHFSRAKV